jgi:hypothetical protein
VPTNSQKRFRRGALPHFFCLLPRGGKSGLDRVAPVARRPFGGQDLQAHFLLQGAAEEAADAVGLPLRSGDKLLQGGTLITDVRTRRSTQTLTSPVLSKEPGNTRRAPLWALVSVK